MVGTNSLFRNIAVSKKFYNSRKSTKEGNQKTCTEQRPKAFRKPEPQTWQDE